MSAEENQEYDERKLFVGGLSWDTTEDSLKAYFSQFGEVAEASVKRDKLNDKPRGFGFVKFKDQCSIHSALEHGGPHELDGKKIDPKLATAKSGSAKPAKVFVGGIPPLQDGGTVEELQEELRMLMEGSDQYKKRKVTEVEIKRSENKDRHRGFGFVTFMRAEDAQAVCSTKYFLFKGKNIEVKVADARSTKQGGGYSAGGQMYYNPPPGHHQHQPHQHQQQWGSSAYSGSGSYGYNNSSEYSYMQQAYSHHPPQSYQQSQGGSSGAGQMSGYESYSYPHGSTQADTGAVGGYGQNYQQSYAYGHQGTGHTAGFAQQQPSSYYSTSQPHHN